MKKITHERLRELLNYDSETGIFTWLVDRNKGRYKAGQVAGSNLKRYLKIEVEGEQHLGHRLAWFWMTGQWPTHQIDHKDQDGFNNRWGNLREATISQNSMNRRRPSHNTSGFKGVTFVNNPEKCGSHPWKATIMREGKRHFLGMFETVEEAGAAYQQAALKLHGEFARAA